MPRPLVFLFALLAACAGAFAHPSGTSHVFVRLLPDDSVTVEIDVNSLDAVTALKSPIRSEAYGPAAARVYQQQVTEYLYSRLRVSADGRPVLSPAPLSWRRRPGADTGAWIDSLTVFDTTHVLTFAGRLPPDARRLQVNAQLFPEFGIQNVSEISVFWRDTLIERKWIGLDKTFSLSPRPDSLDARLAAVRGNAGAPPAPNLFLRFITLGYTHILPYGLDHILFVLALFFFSTRLRPLLLQVTAFTLAHSVTLGLAVLGIFTLPASVVEPLIALSIAVVGLENIFFRKVRASRWLVVFAFGLVHGMGFAGILQTFGFPPGSFWSALIGFNLGVELGQISVIALALAATMALRRKPWYFRRVVVPASLAITAVGLYWTVERIWGL